MKKVIQDFVDKVERGEARSKRSYAAMKQILEDIEPDMKEVE